jgi:hypothetical protein
LDGSGGGSGLLDLTRESDDTSLGAELLENIDMTGTAETAAQTEADDEEDGLAPAQASMPGPEMEPGIAVAMYSAGMVEPVSPAFTGLLAAGLISLGLLGATSIANAVRAWPTYLSALAEQFWIFLAGSLGLAGVCTLAGWFVGKQSSAPRSPRPPKAKKPKKPKKGKKSEESGEAPGVSAA